MVENTTAGFLSVVRKVMGFGGGFVLVPKFQLSVDVDTWQVTYLLSAPVDVHIERVSLGGSMMSTHDRPGVGVTIGG